MKKLTLLTFALLISFLTFSQKRDTEGLKKIDQSTDEESTFNLANLAELAKLAELAELSSLAELGELGELGSLADIDPDVDISVVVDDDIAIVIPELSAELSAELSKLAIELGNVDYSSYANYGQIIEEVMKNVTRELRDVKRELREDQ